MKKIIAIKRNDNGVTWLSGPMDFGKRRQDYVNGETLVEFLYRAFGMSMSSTLLDKPTKVLWLQTRKGQDVFFPLDKIESVKLRDYDDSAYDNTCG